MPLSMKEKQSVTNVMRDEYRKASQKRKSRMLDEFCKLTGYNRSYAARKLRSRTESRLYQKVKKVLQRPRGRKRKYGQECLEPLITVWSVMDFACGKRVAAGMKDVLDALLRSEELSLDGITEEKLRAERLGATVPGRLSPQAVFLRARRRKTAARYVCQEE